MPRTIISKRNGIKLVDDLNYIYDKQKQNASGEKQYWICEIRKCKARLHTNTDEENYVVIKSVGEHNHSASSFAVHAKIAKRKMKEKATMCQDASRSIIANETKNLSECGIAELPAISSLSRSIRRWRQNETMSPPIPQFRHGYVIPDEYQNLECGSRFLQYDSGLDDMQRILIFASNDGLEDLKRFKTWAADGTFKCSPNFYYQLYTLHVQDKEFSIPRLFAFLPDKSQHTYSRFFSIVKDILQNYEPEHIIVDFEKAVVNCMQTVFPQVNVTCCLFHLAQNIYKHVVQCGFKREYHENDEFNLKMRCLSALAFLPLSDVIDGYEELIDDDEIPEEIVSYFQATYIGSERGRGSRRRRAAPLFPIELWNVYERTVNEMPKTNNNVEGFHSALKISVTSSHPNIWKLIDALKQEEALARTKLIQYNCGNVVSKKKKYMKIQQRILKLVKNYDSENKIDFLRSIAHNLNVY